MGDHCVLILFIVLNFLFFTSLFGSIAKIDASSRADEKQIERTAAYQKKVMQEAQKALQQNSRIKKLYDKLAQLPRDGTESRNIQRSKVLRDVLLLSKSKMVAQGLLLLVEQEKQRNERDDGKDKKLKV